MMGRQSGQLSMVVMDLVSVQLKKPFGVQRK